MSERPTSPDAGAAGPTTPSSASATVTERPTGASQDVTQHLLSGRTYRSLGEQRLTPAEERFERGRRTVGLVLAPIVLLLLLVVPMDIPSAQQTLAAVTLTVIVLWVTEALPIPVSGLLGVALVTILGVGTADEVLAPFGSGTVFTFIGAFIIAQAMLKHGLARRFAFRILSLPGVGKTTTRTIVAFGVITCLLSAFVSNTATVAMLLPTAVGILAVIVGLIEERGGAGPGFDPLKLRVGVALMLMLAYGASVGGLLTPVGSPPNLIGRALIEEATGETISFAEWVVMALPICLLMFVVLAVVLLLLNKPEIRDIEGVESYVAEQRAQMGPLSRAEKNTLVAFAVAVTLWFLPGVVALVAGDESSAYTTVTDRLDEGIVAVFAASLLFILPTNWSRREATLNWSDAARIDWGTVILFGSGVIFGALLESTGLAETLGKGSADLFGVSSAVALTIFAVLLAIIVSETTSNTASASIVVPIIIPVAQAAGIDPFIPGLAATFAASFGFMLPVSTPQNAIVYGSGAVPITKMVRSGISFDVAGAILIILLIPLLVAALGVG